MAPRQLSACSGIGRIWFISNQHQPDICIDQVLERYDAIRRLKLVAKSFILVLHIVARGIAVAFCQTKLLLLEAKNRDNRSDQASLCEDAA